MEKTDTDLYQDIGAMKVQVSDMHKALMGDGGLLERFNKLEGGLSTVRWIASSGFVGSILAVCMFVFAQLKKVI